MKKLFVIIISCVLVSLLTLTVSAQEYDLNDIYKQQIEAVNIDDLENALPKDVAEELKKFNIEDPTSDVNEFFDAENIFGIIVSFLKSGCKKPLLSAVSVLAVLLFSAAVGGLATDGKLIDFVVAVGVTASAVLPVASTVAACVDAVKSTATFMLSFVPIFAAVLVSKGKTLTASGFSSVVLLAVEGVNMLCSYIVIPLTGMQLALAVSGCALTHINVESISRFVKKISMWVLSLATTVLALVLGVQTVINAPADNLTSKATKFVIGTAVPVVGTAVSEALATVRGCLNILSSSVAVYGIIALLLLVLPVVTELVLWRVSLSISATFSDILDQKKAASLLRSVDSAISVILGIIILTVVLFIISITVVAVV